MDSPKKNDCLLTFQLDYYINHDLLFQTIQPPSNVIRSVFQLRVLQRGRSPNHLLLSMDASLMGCLVEDTKLPFQLSRFLVGKVS